MSNTPPTFTELEDITPTNIFISEEDLSALESVTAEVLRTLNVEPETSPPEWYQRGLDEGMEGSQWRDLEKYYFKPEELEPQPKRAKRQLCKRAFCTEEVWRKKHCMEHQAYVCEIDDCTRTVKRHGRCYKHPFEFCNVPFCHRVPAIAGYCRTHYLEASKEKTNNLLIYKPSNK